MKLTAILTAILGLGAGSLSAQEIPAPGNQRGAFARASDHYSEAIALVADARVAIQRDDPVAFGNAVREYRRVMPFLLVWHGRACWKADHEGGRVAYPMQATMGEALVAWDTARLYMSSTATELLRDVLAANLNDHGRTLGDIVDEMMRECGQRPN